MASIIATMINEMFLDEWLIDDEIPNLAFPFTSIFLGIFTVYIIHKSEQKYMNVQVSSVFVLAFMELANIIIISDAYYQPDFLTFL